MRYLTWLYEASVVIIVCKAGILVQTESLANCLSGSVRCDPFWYWDEQVRSEHRLARQEQVLEAQVRSVTESMIRQLERTDAESRKRRFQATVQGERRKRTMTESLMAARSRDNKDAKRVLKTVNEVWCLPGKS